MRYRLRTLLIVLALGPPVPAVGWIAPRFGGRKDEMMDAHTWKIVLIMYVARTAATVSIWAAVAYTAPRCDFLSNFSPSERLIFLGMAMATMSFSMFVVWKVSYPPSGYIRPRTQESQSPSR
jgi:hypothetical protein